MTSPIATCPPAGARPAGRGFDLVGTALLALALAGVCLAMTSGGRAGPLAAGLVVAAAARGSWCFSAAPGRRWSARRCSATAAPRGARDSGIVSTVMMATLVVGPFHLSRALGWAGPGGLVMSVGPAVVAVSGVPAGRIATGSGRGP